jgi:hypothetical protein
MACRCVLRDLQLLFLSFGHRCILELITVTVFQWIGICGVFLCLCAYTLNLLQRLPTDNAIYPALNAISSTMILASLVDDFNLAAVLMEGSWLCVSLFAAVSAVRASKP